MFSAESALLAQIHEHGRGPVDVIIALDEVGRGCVAGPVLTCASLWVQSSKQQLWLSQVKDSKKLTPAKRLACFQQVIKEFNYTEHSLPFKNSHLIPRVNLLKSKLVVQYLPDTLPIHSNSMQCIGFCLGEGSIAEVEQFNIWNAVQIAASRALLGLKEFFLNEQNISLNRVVILMDGNKPLAVPEVFVDV
ncbi:MAG: hypothetical protein V4591_09030, partial [Bdellovibrionota bacterium]